VNLLGTALRRAVAALAHHTGRTAGEQATVLGVPFLAGPSLKGALDLDWTDPTARDQALAHVLAALESIERHLTDADDLPPRAATHVAAARQVESQDVTVGAAGQPTLRRGVAANRRISIADGEQRHGRKSRQARVDGYKRHVVRDLAQAGLIRAVAVTGANRPDAAATPAIAADLAVQKVSVGEWHIDRAFFASPLVTDRDATTQIWCKPHRVANGAQFPKTAFTFDPDQQRLTCPAGVTRPARLGRTVRFPADRCDGCVFRTHCTRAKPGVGRSIQVHAEEPLLLHLRAAQATPEGRAKLRERIGVEHSLARVGQIQGDQARYLGERKQLFDTRRAACVVNLQIIDRLPSPAASNTGHQIT